MNAASSAETKQDTPDIDPLASHGMKFAPAMTQLDSTHGENGGAPIPFGLRWRVPVERPAVPEYRFDHQRQISLDRYDRPMAPQLAKDWTTTSYSTDGEDPPSSEEFGWEEI